MSSIFKRFFCITTAVVLLVCFSGCQQQPTNNSVVSKNDGSFDSSIIQSNTQEQTPGATQEIVYDEQFSSSDGSVSFQFSINEQFDASNYPVAEIVPHYLTSEDAKRVAGVLLGNVSFYEQEPLLAPLDKMGYSKEEIRNRIERWSQYTSIESVRQLLGDQMGDPEQTVEIVKKFIADFTELFESTPENQVPKACDWTFKKDSYYYYSADDESIGDVSDDNDSIKAVAKVGNVEYTFEAATRNKNDFKINNIHLTLSHGVAPADIDRSIFRAMLCRTSEPTDEDISAAKSKAQRMLDQMVLGRWKVDSSSVVTTYFGDTPEYIIQVSAVPVISDIPVIRRPQFSNLKSKNTFASNYYLTDANFAFSANGDIVGFEMFSSIDVKSILNANVATKSIDELIVLAKEHLMLSDYYEYGIDQEYLDWVEKDAGEKIACEIDICQMEYGLVRVKVPNTDDSYYYVPGVILSGTIDYIGKDTKAVYDASGKTIWNERIVPLVALNAIDGSIVELYP